MWYRLSIAAAAALVMGGVGATAAELPTYEVVGFPITPHQFMVLGPANAEQALPAAGISSPVLAPRQKELSSVERTTTVLARVYPVVAVAPGR